MKCAIEYENENLAISWIVTLDVLKYELSMSMPNCVSWIVTLDVLKYSLYYRYFMLTQLNSNIRCIEMNERTNLMNITLSWIVTLDVLKLGIVG